jgi:hypothetical protein
MRRIPQPRGCGVRRQMRAADSVYFSAFQNDNDLHRINQLSLIVRTHEFAVAPV